MIGGAGSGREFLQSGQSAILILPMIHRNFVCSCKNRYLLKDLKGVNGKGLVRESAVYIPVPMFRWRRIGACSVDLQDRSGKI